MAAWMWQQFNTCKGIKLPQLRHCTQATPPPPTSHPAILLLVGAMGVGSKDHVVVYDTRGIFSSCRVYWTFKVFGHEKVSILSGGLPDWLAEGYTTASGPMDPVVSGLHFFLPPVSFKKTPAFLRVVCGPLHSQV